MQKEYAQIARTIGKALGAREEAVASARCLNALPNCCAGSRTKKADMGHSLYRSACRPVPNPACCDHRGSHGEGTAKRRGREVRRI
jgi:hypothetical protein